MIPSYLRRQPTDLRAQRVPVGIAVPVRLDPVGRMETASGAEQNASLLRRALQDCRNECPVLQGLGLDHGAVFLPANRATWGILQSSIERVIRDDFAGRVRLISLSMRPGAPGELVAEIRYSDISEGRDAAASIAFRAA